jgi:hypothetical protein
MSKLYGPEEGYQTVVSRTTLKKTKNEEKIIRQQMADLLEDQQPVMKGPPFNPIGDLTKLSHDELITRAKEVITPWNPAGHPPAGVLSPTMQSLIDGLGVTRESYASIANPMRNKSPPSESSYNGSILSEDQESLEKDKHPTVFSPKAKAKIAVKKTTKAMKVKFASLEMTPVSTPYQHCRNSRMLQDLKRSDRSK